MTRQEASVLAMDEGLNVGEDALPSCLEELAGNEFVFQIRVTPFNFTSNHRTFTVSKITKDGSLTNAEKENHVILAGTSSVSPGHGEKTADKCDGAAVPGTSNSQKKCKRRE